MAHFGRSIVWRGRLSPSRLGNKPIRYLILDELDKYQNTKREAAAEALAEKRVITWGKEPLSGNYPRQLLWMGQLTAHSGRLKPDSAIMLFLSGLWQ